MFVGLVTSLKWAKTLALPDLQCQLSGPKMVNYLLKLYKGYKTLCKSKFLVLVLLVTGKILVQTFHSFGSLNKPM